MAFSDGCRIAEERTWRQHGKSVVRDPKRHFGTID